jgi:site-specific DNA recombinase
MTTNGKTRQLDVYARVSRKGDERQRPVEGQVADCLARLEGLGHEVGEVHDQDRGKSAWRPGVKRPGWDALMARLESGATGGVIVFDMARFTRRPIEGERLIAAAERGMVVLDSEQEFDLTTASGKKAFRDQVNAAAYESDRQSTRVSRGKRNKARSGEPNVSSRPFGFRAVQVTKTREVDGKTRTVVLWDYSQPHDTEAKVIQELADRLLAGESQDDMVRDLNARGITTSYGKPWSRASLRQLLTRPRNAGLVEYKGDIVGRMEGEPILSKDVHNKVCAMYAARRRGRPVSDAYLCSGIVRCGLCGHVLTGRPRTNMRPYPDGEPRRQYWCQPQAHDGGCGRITVDQRELDRHVTALTVAILSDPRHAVAVEARARQVTEQRRRLDGELAKLDDLATQLAVRVGRGELPLARYDAMVEPLDKRIGELRGQLEELDAAPLAVPVGVAAELAAKSEAQWRRRWSDAEVDQRRDMVRQALRGRRLVVESADPAGPRRFDPERVQVQEVR